MRWRWMLAFAGCAHPYVSPCAQQGIPCIGAKVGLTERNGGDEVATCVDAPPACLGDDDRCDPTVNCAELAADLCGDREQRGSGCVFETRDGEVVADSVLLHCT